MPWRKTLHHGEHREASPAAMPTPSEISLEITLSGRLAGEQAVSGSRTSASLLPKQRVDTRGPRTRPKAAAQRAVIASNAEPRSTVPAIPRAPARNWHGDRRTPAELCAGRPRGDVGTAQTITVTAVSDPEPKSALNPAETDARILFQASSPAAITSVGSPAPYLRCGRGSREVRPRRPSSVTSRVLHRPRRILDW